jgi:hypothetical protein
MRTYSPPLSALASALILVALSGCSSTAPRLLDKPEAPPIDPPQACLSVHPDALESPADAYLELANEPKARAELDTQAVNGERYGALWRDHSACGAWLRTLMR